MKTVYIEFLGHVPLYLGMGIKIISSLLLGCLIGIDREQKMKSAGIKTNILICIGAAVYTGLSLLSADQGIGVADPNRTAAQIVSGIGFLGAGAIIQGRGAVIGLTTAATIWVVAAVGMTVGFGYPLVASIITITILVVLRLIDPIYKFLESEKNFKRYHIEVLSSGGVKGHVKEIIYNFVDDIEDIFEENITDDASRKILHLYVNLHPRRTLQVQKSIKQLMRVDKVKVHSIERD